MNQPRRVNMAPPVMYYCARHDYAYYDTGWTDPNSGIYYQPGYYDESGVRYDNISIRQNGSQKVKTTCTCQYCSSAINVEWEPGQQVTCPNCGAPIDNLVSAVQTDTIVPDEKPSYSSYSTPAPKKKTGRKIIFIVIGVLLIIGIFAKKDPAEKGGSQDKADATVKTIVPAAQEDSLYVDVLGRECPYLEEYESYYDEETDCYFVYNDYLDYPVWQYWYEGISSDYGDYGWMEYDEEEEQWYIEKGEGEWIVLPGKYDAESLWYIEE